MGGSARLKGAVEFSENKVYFLMKKILFTYILGGESVGSLFS